MMNVNSYNNLAMMSSMTGITQQPGATKQVSGDLPLDWQITETEKDGEARGVKKDDPQPRQQHSARNVARQQAQGVERRHVAEDTGARGSNGTNEPGESGSKTFDNLTGSKLSFDTARNIQYRYQSSIRSSPDQHTMAPQNQPPDRQKLVNNLSKWVDIEYKQFNKAQGAPLSRRDLREVMHVLGNMNTSDSSAAKSETTEEPEEKPTMYNRGNLSKLSKVMRFLDDPGPQYGEELNEFYG